MTLNEAETRQGLIDNQLARAGWNVNNPRQVVSELALRYGGLEVFGKTPVNGVVTR